jgi:hypothetical protein
LIFLESDVTSVVQRVLDVPVVPDCGGGEARRYGGIGHVVCDLGGAAPEAGLGISMQDLTGDADVALKTSADLVSCRLRPVQTEVSLLTGRWEAQAVSTFCNSEG